MAFLDLISPVHRASFITPTQTGDILLSALCCCFLSITACTDDGYFEIVINLEGVYEYKEI